MHSREPRAIIAKIKFPRIRSSAKIGLKEYAKNRKFKNTCINRLPQVYNAIPDELRLTKPSIFKKRLKKTQTK